jgi:hypothetical protein
MNDYERTWYELTAQLPTQVLSGYYVAAFEAAVRADQREQDAALAERISFADVPKAGEFFAYTIRSGTAWHGAADGVDVEPVRADGPMTTEQIVDAAMGLLSRLKGN